MSLSSPRRSPSEIPPAGPVSDRENTRSNWLKCSLYISGCIAFLNPGRNQLGFFMMKASGERPAILTMPWVGDDVAWHRSKSALDFQSSPAHQNLPRKGDRYHLQIDDQVLPDACETLRWKIAAPFACVRRGRAQLGLTCRASSSRERSNTQTLAVDTSAECFAGWRHAGKAAAAGSA
jgi:hypothetical protein